MIIKPFSKSQLMGIQEGLRRDLNAVLNANASSKKKLDKLSSPEYLKKYTVEALAAMRREAVEEESKTVLDIIKSLPDTKQIIEKQREYWDKDFWRASLLYAGVPDVRVCNDALLTTAEKAVQSLANFTAFTNATLLENSGRMWLSRELELMGADQFVKVLQDATETGNAAIIYIAKLAAASRTFNTETEKSKVSAAIIAAERDILLPIRMDSLDILQACEELVSDIESAWMALSTGGDDIRSKMRSYAEERKAKVAADQVAAEEQRRRLDTVEENLFLRSHV
jgi:hypothetical protein